MLARRARVPLTADPGRRRPRTRAVGAGEAGATPVATGPGRGSPRPGSARPRLSAREIEVLRLVAAGRSNGEIGDELFITRKTAGVHVTHILDKLGVSNRVEAAMAAARLGLLEPTRSPPPSRGVADRACVVLGRPCRPVRRAHELRSRSGPGPRRPRWSASEPRSGCRG